MFDPAAPKGNCTHCKSSELEYYGSTFGGFHCYYKCLNCQKYTEYRMGLRNFLMMNLIIFLMMIFTIAVPLSVLSVNSRLAIFVFVGSVILFLILGYKYRWYFYESIAVEDLETDIWIIHASNKNVRRAIAAIFIVVLLSYAGIIIHNLIRE